MKTVVGLYDTFTEAQTVAQALMDGGFTSEEISVVANDASGEYSNMSGTSAAAGDMDSNDGAAAGAVGGTVVGGTLGVLAGLGALAIPGIGPVVAAGPLLAGLAGAGVGAATGGLVGALADAGVPDEDAQYYNDGVAKGGALVSVRTDDGRAQQAADIMNNYDATDVEQRSDSSYSTTDTSYSTTDTAYTGTTGMTDTSTRMTSDTDTIRTGNDDDVIEVIEEDLRIGKRQVQGGGARLYSRVVSEPVEEDITLRNERVTVERTAVDRPADASDFDTFREGTIEMTEMHEEAVVDKQARVVEEIRLNKEVEETTETIRDTVRHTEVDVDQLDTNYRTDYDTRYASSGYSYDQYQPAYQYGSTLANDTNYSDREWADIEGDARTRWEENNQGTWEDFKDAIRRGWDEVRGRR